MEMRIPSGAGTTLGKEEGNLISERYNCMGGERCGDLLEKELLSFSKADKQVVITSDMLFASVFGEENWTEGYPWVHSQIKGTHESLHNRIKIEQSVKYLKRKVKRLIPL